MNPKPFYLIVHGASSYQYYEQAMSEAIERHIKNGYILSGSVTAWQDRSGFTHFAQAMVIGQPNQ